MEHAEPHPVPDVNETFSQTPPRPRIPWERRKHIGYLRAHWRTMRMVMTAPGELEQFLDAPVCEKSAKYFRSFTFQITALLTVCVQMTMFIAMREAQISAQDVGDHHVISLLFSLLPLVGLFLATRSLEWFSRPKDFDPVRQTRALALSCYICAPILIVTVVGAIATAATIAIRDTQDIRPVAQVIGLSWLAVFLAWYPAAVRAIHFTTGRNTKRTVVAALALPVIWTTQQLMMTCLPLSILVWFNMAWSFL